MKMIVQCEIVIYIMSKPNQPFARILSATTSPVLVYAVMMGTL